MVDTIMLYESTTNYSQKVMEMIKCANARSNYEFGSMSLSEYHNCLVKRPAHIVIPIAPESKWSTNIETGFT